MFYEYCTRVSNTHDFMGNLNCGFAALAVIKQFSLLARYLTFAPGERRSADSIQVHANRHPARPREVPEIELLCDFYRLATDIVPNELPAPIRQHYLQISGLTYGNISKNEVTKKIPIK